MPDPDEDGSDPGKDIPDPGEDGSDPGEDGSDPNKDDPDHGYKSSDKGKGKARAITPELLEKPYTDSDENGEEDDFEKARLNSLEEPYNKEESKQGESSKQGANLEYQEFLAEQDKQSKLDKFHNMNKARIESTRQFNDTLEKIYREGDSMDPRDKEFLINETIRLRAEITNYASHAQNLRNELDINSSEEFSYEEDNSEESWNEDSSEESRPSKRSDSSEEESRPSKRPRN